MKICLYDPGIENNTSSPSSNLGDIIIQESVKKVIMELFPEPQIDHISTHSYPNRYEMSLTKDSDFIFVGGTNLLGSRLFLHKQWKVSLSQKIKINRAILLGVGWGKYDKPPNFFSKFSLRAVLSKNYLHSVRDNYTKNMLKKCGILNVINTGCPTMWDFDRIDQDSIPKIKSDNVLVMLTDYSICRSLDSVLLRTLNKFYQKIYFWPQGRKDKEYILSLTPLLSKPVVLLEHDYSKFNQFLDSDIQFDYIGTRLHGGIKCLRAKRRSLILSIDNRASEISKDTDLPTVDRSDFTYIKKWISGPTGTQIKINTSAINHWKSQFLTTN